MRNIIDGIHHVTAIAGDPQSNLDFYTSVLGLRLVKRTVNFDDPYTYHFYFGDENGTPGSIMTFFPWGAGGHRGSRGTGQITAFALSIPHGATAFWTDRFEKLGVPYQKPAQRFDGEVIVIEDPDGFVVELVASSSETRPAAGNGAASSKAAVRGIHSVTISQQKIEPTSEFMKSALGMHGASSHGNRHRFVFGDGEPGKIVDLLEEPGIPSGRMGPGVIHHLAFRTPDDSTQAAVQADLVRAGYPVSDVKDRQYFHSIYFNEPGRVLFEVATDPPGFLIDEKREALGSGVKLPLWLEPHRKAIEHELPVIVVRRAETEEVIP